MTNNSLSDTTSMNDQDLNQHEVRQRLLTSSQSALLENSSENSSNDFHDHQTHNLIDSVFDVPTRCVEQAKEVGKFVVDYVVDHSHLPHWLIDNEFLISGHRPPMPSVKQCFASIFRLHTETVNIWTHLLGTFVFIGIAIYFLTRPASEVHIEKKLIFGAFFLGAIVCLLCSTLYHILYCHSPKISKFFSKLDYCGIAILIIGSVVPLLYYQFYCEFGTKIAYLSLIGLLGITCIVISMWDRFASSDYRVYRVSGATQYLLLVAVLYVIGAALYAARIPERLAPGLFDIWFQSHQLFHVFVVAAACVHYYGICVLSHNQANYFGDCRVDILTSNTGSLVSLIN
ncbi:unnamed protein product [Rotaria sp. Silwood2]|nr:unnamed protein product [Rotaria sp. Silwood2]